MTLLQTTYINVIFILVVKVYFQCVDYMRRCIRNKVWGNLFPDRDGSSSEEEAEPEDVGILKFVSKWHKVMRMTRKHRVFIGLVNKKFDIDNFDF